MASTNSDFALDSSQSLKDTEDAVRYLGVFENGRLWFAEMGVTFTEEESIVMLAVASSTAFPIPPNAMGCLS